MTQILIIENQTRENIRKLLEFAGKPENLYIPGPNAKIPGDCPEHTIQMCDFRCVFSFTKIENETWRHLSISMPNKNGLPNRIICEEIARLLEFSGKFEDWTVHPLRNHGIVIIAQKTN